MDIVKNQSEQKGTEMVDKSFHLFLMIFFGMGTIVILILSWLTPMPIKERILMTAFAAISMTLAWKMR